MGPVGRFFGGEATSEVDLRWGLNQDLWLAIQPDLRKLKGPIRRGERPARASSRGEAIVAVARRYRTTRRRRRSARSCRRSSCGSGSAAGS